jgi:hypothetical protein
MSLDFESILPKKNKNGLQPFAGNRNALIDVCIENLKQAEARGEICKPLGVEDVINIACKFCKEPCDDIKARCWDKAREVHNAMLGKERK